MKKFLAALLLLSQTAVSAQAFVTRFERSGGKESADYFEIIRWWRQLDDASSTVRMRAMGPTDAGFPLHLVTVSAQGIHDLATVRKKNLRIILINNGIHPGEPDGIDASMLLARDIVAGKFRLPPNVVLAIIPVYNIGGCLNRSPNYRVDQNGPLEKGSRGNSQNLDLNRDFIKCDSREARSFTEIFHLLDPDVFVDNHVSNGADYQHVMTLLTTQHSKLDSGMARFLRDRFEPELYQRMHDKGYSLVPYVNVFGENVENGWPAFWDSPRYGSGYAALWHTFSFVPETHMLKPYDLRVRATKALMESFIGFTSQWGEKIAEVRQNAKARTRDADSLPLSWSLDRARADSIWYKGYRSERRVSAVSGLPRLYYDRSRPFEKRVPFYNYYKPEKWVTLPKAYVIPRGWWRVIDLLKLNRVRMRQLARDTLLDVEVYRIDDYRAASRQYEMHHPNSDVKVSTSSRKMIFRKGDYYIPMNQPANRFLVATLEPQAEDSYFTWNFFDAILGQKEGFSAYAFEDSAAAYLARQPGLRTRLEERRRTDSSFARSARAQLNFVYENSPWMEPEYLRYPVYRVRLVD
ncbi:MAG TPA: M14 family metallopeptidase [Chitinophagaceae bacterium]|nr:M14 family metallopeptidase [Chitinophagaceae bacterium]